MTDIDRRTYQRIEAGTSDPRYGDLVLIAHVLGIPLEELVRQPRPGTGRPGTTGLPAHGPP